MERQQPRDQFVEQRLRSGAGCVHA
jgi:hypothetical protein